MRKLYVLHLFLLWGLNVTAQNITQIEYFIDVDPGYGSATQVSGFTSAPRVTDFNFTIPVTSLTNGFHRFFLRAKDSKNNWSVVRNHLFYKETIPAVLSNIVRLEYFIDTDPGYGLGTSVAITAATRVDNKSFTIPVSSLSAGAHRLYLRAQDASGKWSVLSKHLFFKELIPATLPNIVKVEYFIDTDPGFDNATNVPVTPGTVINDLNFDITSLTEGDHKLFIRAKNASGAWSVVTIKEISVPPLPVTLVDFTAQKEENTVQLNWKTTEETNSDRFEINHSTDGKQWNLIGTVTSSGESNVLKHYAFIHLNPKDGGNLYKLKMIDRAVDRKDGSFTYSRIVSVEFQDYSEITIFPNPSLNNVTVTSKTPIKGYKLLNVNGQLIQEKSELMPGRKIEMKINRVQTGLYILQLQFANGNQENRKLVIE